MDVAAVDLADVNLMDPRWFADGPPHALFARMRAEAPVRWNPTPDGGGFWSLTRHAEVAAVSRDPEAFSSYRSGIFLHPDQVLPLELTRNLLLYKDPPDHTKYRQLLQDAFVPGSVRLLEGRVRARVERILDAIAPKGECDFVHEVAVPIPLAVLADLMGIPDGDIPKLHAWTEQIEQAQRAPEPAAALPVFAEMGAYLQTQIERQLAERDDNTLVMRLHRAEVDGQRLTDTEILVFFGLLVFAGNDTTRNTMATGLLTLLEHPDQLELLRRDASLIPRQSRRSSATRRW